MLQIICMIIKSLEGIELNNIHKDRKRGNSSLSACPKTKSHLSKRRNSLLYSLSPLSSLASSMSCDRTDDWWLELLAEKRWMVLTQLDRERKRQRGTERKQHPSRVMNMNQCIINKTRRKNQWRDEEEKISLFTSLFSIGQSSVNVVVTIRTKKKPNFVSDCQYSFPKKNISSIMRDSSANVQLHFVRFVSFPVFSLTTSSSLLEVRRVNRMTRSCFFLRCF